jgi:hypothetical protein
MAEDAQPNDSACDTSDSDVSTLVQRKTLAIQSVKPGMRVVADNPRRWEIDETFAEPDAASWRLIRAVVFRADGGVVQLELLRPEEWILQNGLAAGHTIAIQLTELNVDGLATIQSIEACPPIAAGEGSVVLGRFRSYCVDNMVTLGLSDGTELQVTSVHLFWSTSRLEWIEAGELAIGEDVDTLDGPLQVTKIDQRAPAEVVYNLEVHGEHVYRVANCGVLVHNSYTEANAQVKGAKPLNSPDPQKWVDKGGNVWNELDGTWVYQDKFGNVVRYPSGHPDFKSAGHVRQEVDIKMTMHRPTDDRLANASAPMGDKLPSNTWHHHENMTTMQEVDGPVHARFTHRGAVSIKKRGQ